MQASRGVVHAGDGVEGHMKVALAGRPPGLVDERLVGGVGSLAARLLATGRVGCTAPLRTWC